MTIQKFPARLDLLHQMLGWILKNIEIFDIKKSDLRKVEIASEEVLVNIINHAYQGQADKAIKIQIEANSNFIELKFIDSGPKFNPTEEEITYESNTPLEERSLGGLGLIMIRQYMDDIKYERSGDLNILTITKQI